LATIVRQLVNDALTEITPKRPGQNCSFRLEWQAIVAYHNSADLCGRGRGAPLPGVMFQLALTAIYVGLLKIFVCFANQVMSFPYDAQSGGKISCLV
jgi:hypothetical protein